MPDKSAFSNNNRSQIPDDLQNYINEMVNEIIISKKGFDDQKKKLLKKVVEREGYEYDSLEQKLSSLFNVFTRNKNNCSDLVREKVKVLATDCFLTVDTTRAILQKMKSPKVETKSQTNNTVPKPEAKARQTNNRTSLKCRFCKGELELAINYFGWLFWISSIIIAATLNLFLPVLNYWYVFWPLGFLCGFIISFLFGFYGNNNYIKCKKCGLKQ